MLVDPESSTDPPRKFTLDQFLKIHRWVDSGGQAKVVIQSGEVRVNGETETRRRRQLAVGDRIEFQGRSGFVDKID